MARIAGIEIPKDKKVKISLTYIYGIGNTKAMQILELIGVDPETRVKDLTEGEVQKIRDQVENAEKTEGELRQEVFRDIKRLKDIKSYRGVRHKIGLPVRGQRTRVNARSHKGSSNPVGGLKNKITKK